jgi:two-component system chemotaxis sensor kinase CheA
VPNGDRSHERFADSFMEEYFAECDEHLTAMRRILLAAERDPKQLSAAAIGDLFRSFHSVKGLSGMVELREAELLAHQMEGYLRALRDRTSTATVATIATLIEGTHALEQVIAARRGQLPTPPVDAILARLEALPGNAPSTAGDARTPPANGESSPRLWRATFAPTPALAARGVGVDSVRSVLRESGEIIEAVPRVNEDGSIHFEFIVESAFDDFDAELWAQRGLTLTPIAATPDTATPADEPVADAAASTPAALSPSHHVRVDLSRLDDLMRMIGDLVISRSRLADSLARIERRIPAVEWRSVQENSLALERQLRDLREGVMRVRLVPIGDIFRRMPFVVRDLAQESGKQVELAMRGQDTEIDKVLIERMVDPVLHLVRNAVSHGIESPAERVKAGKPATATITLSAASVGDLVVLEIADDGRGVDADAVARRARAAGLAVPENRLDDDALLQILCAPGFSTRDEADRASGRGVGMAVVQTTVHELGGRLSLDTTPGRGSRFLIELPLTLAIVDAIIARVGDETFAVAQSSIREVIEVDPGALHQLENNEVVPYRGGVLPIVRVSRAFKIESRPGRALHVFVVGQGASATGLAVDKIVGQREIVVRTLADALVKVEGVVGATDLGDGRAVLILDAQRLIPRGHSARSGA